MKAVIIIAIIAAVVFGMVSAFSSTLGDPEYPVTDKGVTGPLALGAVSEALHAVDLWKQPLESYSVKRRDELRAGVLRRGDVFVVLNHVQKGDLLWFHVRGRDDASLTGYFKSPSDDPVRARRLE